MRAFILLSAGLSSVVFLACDPETETGGGTSAGMGGQAGGGTASSSGGSSGGSGGGSSASSSSASSTGSGMGCGTCDFTCCGAACINLDNDINNCGECGVVCPGSSPYCNKGKCDVPPCNGPLCGPGQTCCLSQCCAPGDLCCTIRGPVGDTTACSKPTESGTCPTGCASCMCTSPDTPIATPSGDRPIASLREGDLVYSIDAGQVAAVRIKAVTSMPAPGHVVVEVSLATGAVLRISPKHPTGDGRSFADLTAGSLLDGVEILSARSVPYAHDRTFDILPDSDTGTYYAGGVLIGSTLAQSAIFFREPSAPMSSASQ